MDNLVELILCSAHLLDCRLKLTGMSKLALDKFSLQALFYLRREIKLIMHTLMFVEDPFHV